MTIAAGQQFLGNEFNIIPKSPYSEIHRVREVLLKMGSEAKTWTIEKVLASGERFPILSSAGASVARSVVATQEHINVTLWLGDQIQVTTEDATSEMSCCVEYETESFVR